MKYIAAPLYYQLLMTDEPLTEAAADRAAAAALAAARAGVLDTALITQTPGSAHTPWHASGPKYRAA